MPSDGGFHTAEGSSRKRIKISRDAGRPVGDMPTSVTIASPVIPPTINAITPPAPAHGAPCHHEQSLRTLHTDLDAMRQLITCKICQRFLYEPYALTCGHTFCYSCLSQWMGQNNKKTCPDCRTVIKEQPGPSYLIREMVLVFVGRSELLPDGETAEEHNQYAMEEAEIVAKDKANADPSTGGLFKGCFNRPRTTHLLAIRDGSDNVDRCPQCLNEVEDGRCLTCNVRVHGQDDDDFDWSSDDSDEDSEQIDQELAAEMAGEDDMGLYGSEFGDFDDHDQFDDMDGFHQGAIPHMHQHGPVRIPHMYSDDEDDSDDEEDDTSMNGFIVDEDETLADRSRGDLDSEEEAEEDDGPSQRRRRQNMVVLSDDDDEDEEDDVPPVRPRRRRVVAAVEIPSNRPSEEPSENASRVPISDDSEDEGPIAASQRSRLGQASRSGYPISYTSDEEDSDDDTEVMNQAVADVADGFSPLDYSSTNQDCESDDNVQNTFYGYEQHDDEDDEDNEDEDDQSVVGAVYGQPDDSMDEDEDQEEHNHDDDGRSTATGWGPTPSRAILLDQVLTCFADTPTDRSSRPRVSFSYRLGTLQPRPSRHAEPGLPSSSSLYPNRPPTASTAYRHSTTARGTFRPPAATNRSIHPFQLGDTLARINSRSRQASAAGPTRSAGGSNVSTQSSAAGGVEVASSASASSGSSRTIRGDEAPARGRRRRIAEVFSDNSDQ